MSKHATITDQQAMEKHRRKREALEAERPPKDDDGVDGNLGEALKSWSEHEERRVQCVARRDGCDGMITQRRPKVMKGRAWEQPICRTCKGILDVAVAESDARERRDRSLGERTIALEVPPLYAEVSFENFQLHGDGANKQRQLKLVTGCRRVVEEWPEVPGIILFMGGAGTGKGHLAWAIAKAIVQDKGEAVRFISLPDLIRELREGWSHPAADPESIVLDRYREPPLLVIDEVSRHAYYGEPTPHLYHLINHRLNWIRPTILTTNEDADGLQEALSGPLLSRIQGENAIWDFGDVDFRAGREPWL